MQPSIVYTGVVNDGNEDRVGAATPPVLTRFEDFLNTLDERRFARHGLRHAGEDLLATEADLAAWLARHGLLQPGEQVDGESFALALALRRALRAALAARAGQETDPGAFAAFPSLPLRLAVDGGGGAALLPAEDGARGHRRPGGGCRRCRGRGGMAAAEDVRPRRLPLGLLRRLAQRARSLVHDGRLRQ